MNKIRYALRTAWLVICAVAVVLVVLNVFVFNKLFGGKTKKISVVERNSHEN
ncbi:MAG: hypothetical protein WC900_07025 [Oscillospiraceae bacterium]|jgi:uncharacterized membrane protein YdfJ with MMPL/SSD domain